VNIDLKIMRPAKLAGLLNSTCLGEVTSEGRVRRNVIRAGLRVGDSTKVNVLAYAAWLLASWHARRTRKRMTPVPVSPPGTPPRAVRPHPWIREFLYYGYDPGTASVVIGPMRLSSRINVPALHEFGGTVAIRNRRRRVRKAGHAGEIDVRGGRVVYSRLRTAAQVARANRLNEQLYGPMYRIATYPSRAFMGPALAAAQPSLPKLWAASVRAAS